MKILLEKYRTLREKCEPSIEKFAHFWEKVSLTIAKTFLIGVGLFVGGSLIYFLYRDFGFTPFAIMAVIIAFIWAIVKVADDDDF